MIPIFIKALSKAKPLTPTVKVAKKPKAAGEKAPDLGNYAGLLSMLADHTVTEDGFGPHNVEKGHKVAFKAGSFVGAGRVAATGKHGLTVEDDDARNHQVHWHEVTGCDGGKAVKPAKPKKAAGDAA
jgi:hypothetical protein